MDKVNHPDHYQGCSPLTRHILVALFGEGCKEWLDDECIDFIEDMHLNFHLGNAVKYLWRVDKKGDPVEDLQKALFYLELQSANKFHWGNAIKYLWRKALFSLNRQSSNAYLEEKTEIYKLIDRLS